MLGPEDHDEAEGTQGPADSRAASESTQKTSTILDDHRTWTKSLVTLIIYILYMYYWIILFRMRHTSVLKLLFKIVVILWQDLMRLKRKESDLKQIIAQAHGAKTRLKYSKAELENLRKKNILKCQAVGSQNFDFLKCNIRIKGVFFVTAIWIRTYLKYQDILSWSWCHGSCPVNYV